jgi:hemin uptake protein HemP
MPPDMTETSTASPLDLPQEAAAVPNVEPPRYCSETLFQGQREVLILHLNETYRLRITKTNKLILTK